MNELQLRLFTKEDFTDKSIVQYLSENKQFSTKEYSDFILNKELRSDLSENIIKFISTYDKGFLKPDKCNAYEPINKRFDGQDIAGPISWLSQPGGAFYFKKVKPYQIEGRIENHRFGPIWEENKIVRPNAPEPIHKGELTLFFDERLVQKHGVIFWKELVSQLCKSINATTGFISLTDDNDDFQKSEDGVITLSNRASEIFDFKHLSIK